MQAGRGEGQLQLTMSPLIPSSQPLLNPSLPLQSPVFHSPLSTHLNIPPFSSTSFCPSPFNVLNALGPDTSDDMKEMFLLYIYFFQGEISSSISLFHSPYLFVPLFLPVIKPPHLSCSGNSFQLTPTQRNNCSLCARLPFCVSVSQCVQR